MGDRTRPRLANLLTIGELPRPGLDEGICWPFGLEWLDAALHSLWMSDLSNEDGGLAAERAAIRCRALRRISRAMLRVDTELPDTARQKAACFVNLGGEGCLSIDRQLGGLNQLEIHMFKLEK